VSVGDGRQIVVAATRTTDKLTGTEGATAILMDTETARVVRWFPSEDWLFKQLIVTADGKRMFTLGSTTGKVHAWDLEPSMPGSPPKP
jgi:hypothetical protein